MNATPKCRLTLRDVKFPDPIWEDTMLAEPSRQETGVNSLSDWTLLVPLPAEFLQSHDDPRVPIVRLFGVTEDTTCRCETSEQCHQKEMCQAPFFCRRLCPHCRVPICSDCSKGLQSFRYDGNIPMAIANDNYYGYVNRLLVQHHVTWLEVAASTQCWSTILVYHLEEP